MAAGQVEMFDANIRRLATTKEGLTKSITELDLTIASIQMMNNEKQDALVEVDRMIIANENAKKYAVD
jgi:prefoldin subunit 5